MAYSVKNEGLINSFKGELIENELYQSADNMVDRNNIYSHPIKHCCENKNKTWTGERATLLSFKFTKTIGMQVNKWEYNSNSKCKGVLCNYTWHIVYMIN